jgi:hypothetical protein
VNTDAEARAPSLRAEHLELLHAQPLLQRLPYRDHEVGVELWGVSAQTKPLLSVIYRGSLDAARADMRALLRRLRDSGREYAFRYQSLGGQQGRA